MAGNSNAGTGEWTTNVFQCGQDMSGCIDVTLCSCCAFGRQCAALEGTSNSMSVSMCLLGYCCPLILIPIRSKIRERFAINGSCLGDFCIGCLCSTCVHCQNHRELTNRGFWPGGTCCQQSPPGGVG